MRPSSSSCLISSSTAITARVVSTVVPIIPISRNKSWRTPARLSSASFYSRSVQQPQSAATSSSHSQIKMFSSTTRNNQQQQEPKNGAVVGSKRGQKAVTLLPSYLADARAVQVYDPITCPNGALQLGVAETKLMEHDWTLPALNTFLSSPGALPASAIYYQPTSGRTDCKEIIATYIEEMLALDECNKKLILDGLILGAGCNAVLENLCFTLADPGDACLIPTPYYAAFEFDLAARASLTVIPVTTMEYYKRHDETTSSNLPRRTNQMDPAVYYPTVEALDAAYERAIEKGSPPKILLLSHPMNPLGICYPPHIIVDCIEWCRSKQIHCISDEIYAGSVYSTAEQQTINENQQSPFVSALKIASSTESSTSTGLGLGPYVHWVYALSKDFGLSGLRVGAAYTENTDIILPMQKLNDLCQISSQTQLWTANMLQAKHPNPQQAETEEWYKAFRTENHKRLLHRAIQLTNLFDTYNIPYLVPTAGLFVWVNLSQFLPTEDTYDPERTLYLEMIQQYGLLLTPGSSMKNEQPGFFRFVFTAATDMEYELALQRMETFLTAKTLKPLS